MCLPLPGRAEQAAAGDCGGRCRDRDKRGERHPVSSAQESCGRGRMQKRNPRARLKEKLEVLLKELGVSLCQIQALASIDLKRDEAGLLELAQECRVPFATYSADELQEIEAVSSHSEFVEKTHRSG